MPLQYTVFVYNFHNKKLKMFVFCFFCFFFVCFFFAQKNRLWVHVRTTLPNRPGRISLFLQNNTDMLSFIL